VRACVRERLQCDTNESMYGAIAFVWLASQYVSCKIIEMNDNDKIFVSLRKSDVAPSEQNLIVDPVVKSTADLSEGKVVRGYVTSANPV
jgi:ribosomal protein S1